MKTRIQKTLEILNGDIYQFWCEDPDYHVAERSARKMIALDLYDDTNVGSLLDTLRLVNNRINFKMVMYTIHLCLRKNNETLKEIVDFFPWIDEDLRFRF